MGAGAPGPRPTAHSTSPPASSPTGRVRPESPAQMSQSRRWGVAVSLWVTAALGSVLLFPTHKAACGLPPSFPCRAPLFSQTPGTGVCALDQHEPLQTLRQPGGAGSVNNLGSNPDSATW